MKTYFNKKYKLISLCIGVILMVSAIFIVETGLLRQKPLLPDNPFESETMESIIVALQGEEPDVRIDTKQPEEADETTSASSDTVNQNPEENETSIDSETQRTQQEADDSQNQRRDKTPDNSKNQGREKDSDNDRNPQSETIQETTENQEGNGKKPVQQQTHEEEKAESEYFTTTIHNNEIVTKPEYSFTIIQKSHGLQVTDVRVTVNERDAGEFSGIVLLEEGENEIAVAIRYQKKDNTSLRITQKYHVFYKAGQPVIYTSLIDEEIADQPSFSFEAYGVQDGKILDTSVYFNDRILNAEKGTVYVVTLKEGSNHIRIVTGNDRGNQKQADYTVIYQKTESTISFETDLFNHTVKESQFKFYAKAYCDGIVCSCQAVVNGEMLTPDEEGNYGSLLKEGENEIILSAEQNGIRKQETYTIIYEKQISGGGNEEMPVDENKNKPIIYTDLADGTTVSGTIKNMETHAKDYLGNYIDPSGIQVFCNGQSAELIWANLTQISYRLHLTEGANEIEIRAVDEEGNESVKFYTLYCNSVNKDEVLGKATISVEATTLGMGYLVPPTEVEITEGENCAYILDRLLKSYGYDYRCTGTLERGFYLESILFHENILNPQIPEDLAAHCEAEADYFDNEEYQSSRLGEFDFCNGSGWMYSVNGVYPNYGFSDCYLNPGDTVRIRFTLYYGKDIGGFGALGTDGENWEKEW